MVAAGGRHDGVAAAKAVLPDKIRSHVRVAGVGEVAVARATDEPTITRRIEPPERLRVGDDRRDRLLRLLLPRTAASAIAAIAAAVAIVVELLIVGTSAVLAPLITALIAALVPVVPGLSRLTEFPRFARLALAGPLLLIAIFARGPLLLFPGLRCGLSDRSCGWGSWDVLGRDRGVRARR